MSSKKRRVCFSLDSRATYGYAKNVLKVLSQFDKLEYRTIVLGGHLSKKHGYSIKEIIKDNIRVDEKVKFEETSPNTFDVKKMTIVIIPFFIKSP